MSHDPDLSKGLEQDSQIETASMSAPSMPGASPVVLFAYARPEHTERTIRSLAANEGAIDRDVIVFADGPRSERVTDAVNQVRSFLGTLPARGWFRSIQVRAANENLGLARSVIRGVSEVLSEHDSVVVIEDDLELAPDFLNFMDAALTYYRAEHRIWSISGFTSSLPSLASYSHDVYLAPRACSWGWATWRRSWAPVDWLVGDYSSFEWSFKRRRAFNRGGPDLSAMLDGQMDGRIDSWAVRWYYSQHLHGGFTVYPTTSKVRNLGWDGSGTHGVQTPFSDSVLRVTPVTLEHVPPDVTVLRDFTRSFRQYNKCPPWSFMRHLAAKRTGRRKAGR